MRQDGKSWRAALVLILHKKQKTNIEKYTFSNN